MEFDDAKSNFISVARSGIDTELLWMNKMISTTELVRKELLPIARADLEKASIKSEDVDRYMDIIDERASSRRTD